MQLPQQRLSSLLRSPAKNTAFWSIAYLAVGLFFLSELMPNNQCGVGFTSMIAVGDHFYDESLDDFKAAAPRIHENSYGYDAQFYAQIALDPTLQDPQLNTAVDTLRYRARRILMPAVAWLIGGGDPYYIVQLFPLINPICWFISAALLLQWLPPSGIQNFIRWAGILLGWGWISSVERSLTDGPAATLTLLAAFLITRGHFKSGAFSIAASALTKDVSLLSGLAIFEKAAGWKSTLLRFGVRGLFCVAPLFLWMLYLNQVTPEKKSSFLGSGNFSFPFQQISLKILELWNTWISGGPAKMGFYLICFIAIATHIVFILLRPKWGALWWRIGIGFAVLGACLGPAVWADQPGAAPRVLLVLHIAFNLLVPKTKIWLPILLLGNVSVFDFTHIMEPPELSQRSQNCLEQRSMITLEGRLNASPLEIRFLDSWHIVESHEGRTWKWSEDQGNIEFVNHGDSPIEAMLTVRLVSMEPRTSIIIWNGEERARIPYLKKIQDYPIGSITIEAGPNLLSIDGDIPAQHPGNGDPRRLGTAIYHIILKPKP